MALPPLRPFTLTVPGNVLYCKTLEEVMREYAHFVTAGPPSDAPNNWHCVLPTAVRSEIEAHLAAMATGQCLLGAHADYKLAYTEPAASVVTLHVDIQGHKARAEANGAANGN